MNKTYFQNEQNNIKTILAPSKSQKNNLPKIIYKLNNKIFCSYSNIKNNVYDKSILFKTIHSLRKSKIIDSTKDKSKLLYTKLSYNKNKLEDYVNKENVTNNNLSNIYELIRLSKLNNNYLKIKEPLLNKSCNLSRNTAFVINKNENKFNDLRVKNIALKSIIDKVKKEKMRLSNSLNINTIKNDIDKKNNFLLFNEMSSIGQQTIESQTHGNKNDYINKIKKSILNNEISRKKYENLIKKNKFIEDPLNKSYIGNFNYSKFSLYDFSFRKDLYNQKSINNKNKYKNEGDLFYDNNDIFFKYLYSTRRIKNNNNITTYDQININKINKINKDIFFNSKIFDSKGSNYIYYYNYIPESCRKLMAKTMSFLKLKNLDDIQDVINKTFYSTKRYLKFKKVPGGFSLSEDKVEKKV